MFVVKPVTEDSSKIALLPDGTPKKRRGRPKKQRPENGAIAMATGPASSSVSAVGNHTPDMSMENVLSGAVGTCKPSTASSVSSGYSSGTASCNDDRRREENGSLSNTGSSGPSPSHHSFTTQSDLSSEISAAISCGSAPPSPLNNQTDSMFEGIAATNNHYREDAQGNPAKHHPISTIHGSNHNNPPHFPNTTICHSTPAVSNTSESQHESSYPPGYHQSYESRLQPPPPQQPSSRVPQGQAYQPPNLRGTSAHTYTPCHQSSTVKWITTPLTFSCLQVPLRVKALTKPRVHPTRILKRPRSLRHPWMWARGPSPA